MVFKWDNDILIFAASKTCNVFFVSPDNISSGFPLILLMILTSLKLVPVIQTVPSALKKASFAAKRAA